MGDHEEAIASLREAQLAAPDTNLAAEIKKSLEEFEED